MVKSRCKLLAPGGVLCAVLLVSCVKDGGAIPPAKGEPDSPSVPIALSEFRPMEWSIPVTGALAAQEESVLGAKVPGRIQRVAVNVGSRVRRGDVLVQIEPRDYELREHQARAALAQARAATGLPLDGDDDRLDLETISAVREARTLLDEATRNRDRAADLSRSGILSRADLDAVEAAFAVARTRHDRALEDAGTRAANLAQRRAEHEIARKQLEDTAVRAPYDGIVQERTGNVGEYVAAGAAVVTIVASDPLRLRLDIPEREAYLVEVGQVVRLRVEGDDRTHTGRIARVSPALDTGSRMLRCEAEVPASGTLRPGLFAEARIVIDAAQETLSVPATAIVTFAGIEKVLVVEDGKAKEKTVTTGRRDTDWVEIVSGLGAGEAVLATPGGIRSGQPVRAANGDGARPNP